jgi:hypothetical protein
MKLSIFQEWSIHLSTERQSYNFDEITYLIGNFKKNYLHKKVIICYGIESNEYYPGEIDLQRGVYKFYTEIL